MSLFISKCVSYSCISYLFISKCVSVQEKGIPILLHNTECHPYPWVWPMINQNIWGEIFGHGCPADSMATLWLCSRIQWTHCRASFLTQDKWTKVPLPKEPMMVSGSTQDTAAAILLPLSTDVASNWAVNLQGIIQNHHKCLLPPNWIWGAPLISSYYFWNCERFGGIGEIHIHLRLPAWCANTSRQFPLSPFWL